MLQDIRDKSKSWVSVAIIVVIILSFALWGVQRLFVGGSASGPVAKVGRLKISQQAFSVEYNHARQQAQMHLGAQYASYPNLSAELKQNTLHALVSRTAMLHQAGTMGLAVGQSLLDVNIATMPAFQENGQFSQNRFSEVTTAMGYSSAQFISMLSNELLLQQLQAGIIGSEFVLPGELTHSLGLLNQERQFKYVDIPNALFTTSVHPSLSEARAYYQKNAARFRLPEKVSVDYLALSLADFAKQVHPTEQALNQFYQENLSRFHQQPYSKVKTAVREAYAQATAQRLFAQAGSKLTNLSYEYPNSLAPIAKQLGIPVRTSNIFSRTDGHQGIAKSPQIVAAAFSDQVLNQHANSDVLTLANSAIVLRIKTHQLSKERAFSSVKNEIVQTLKTAQANEKALAFSVSLAQSLSQGRLIDSLLAQHHLQWQTSGFVARTDKQLNPILLNAAFIMPLANKAKPSVTHVNLGASHFAVIELTASRMGESTLTKAQQNTYQEVMTHAYGQTAYELFQNHVLSNSDIKYYPQNINVN